MGKSSAPKAPDPYKVADAQSQANIDAIRESAKINALNTYSPYGSTVFQKDSKGIPISQTMTLSPQEQAFYDTSGQIKNSLAGKAQGYLNYLPSAAFAGPDQGAGDAVSKALYDRRLGMVKPQLDEADNALRLQLSERGIPIGSEIYKDEMNRLSRARGDTLAAISQDATLAGGQEYDRQLANSLTIRNQPFNEISAFLQGAPSMPTPQFSNQPGYQVAAPDISGLIQNDYATRLAQSNQSNSSLMNGLFGLGSAALGMFSDVRLKENIEEVGQLDNGLPVYSYNYIDGGPTHIGVMAQDVEKTNPTAVNVDPASGFKRVDYARATR